MDQSVKMSCAFLDLLSHVVFHFHVEDVRDQIECILIVLHFCIESSEIESVRQVILVDFAEVFIPPRRYELPSESVSAGIRFYATVARWSEQDRPLLGDFFKRRMDAGVEPIE